MCGSVHPPEAVALGAGRPQNSDLILINSGECLRVFMVAEMVL